MIQINPSTQSDGLLCQSCAARCGIVCGALGESGLSDLLSRATQATLPMGAWLVLPGDPADHVFLFRSGHAHVSRITREGKQQILTFIFPGDFYSFTPQRRYVAGVYADTELSVCRISRRHFEEVVSTYPTLDRRLRTQLALQLDGANELIFTLGRKSALERVASFVWYLNYRQRKLGHTGAETYIPMSRAAIGDFLGLTGESVSRCLTRLRQAGLIQLPGPTSLRVLDMSKIREVGLVVAEPDTAVLPPLSPPD